MILREIKLRNFRKFENLDFTFSAENLLVLTGPNGSGKSTILDAISKCLAHYVAKLISYSDEIHAPIDPLRTSDITNDEIETSVLCGFNLSDYGSIKVSKRRDQKGFSYQFSGGLKEEILLNLRKKILTDDSVFLPLIMYYRTNRTIKVSSSKESSNDFYHPILEGYKNSVNAHSSPFIDFEKWFIRQENLENEEIKQRKDFSYELPALKAMRTVILDFLSFFYEDSELKIEVSRKPQNLSDFPNADQGNILVDFGDQKKPVMLSQLSSGEKMIFLIVADIARRLLILNKGNPDFENHRGIVLIDEIGLHLHPKWQRQILPALHHVFPNVQFICTTHSPQVISLLRKENILQIDHTQIYASGSDPKGGESGIILEEIFGTSRRPEKAQRSIKTIFRLLESEKINFERVEEKINELKDIVDEDDPIFLQLGNYMERRKLLMS